MKRKIVKIRAACEAMERRLLFSSLNVLTHHQDATNDGDDAQETVLTPTNVNATDFGKQFTNAVDGGDVIAEPLYMQNVNITTGTSAGVHSVVFVATEADGLYALDASTGATLWHDNFTNTTDPTNLTPTTGVTTILESDINNNPDVGSQLGILATPAIDPNTGILYLNANTKEIRADGKHFVQRLWAISINNGMPVLAPTVIGDTIAPNGLQTTGPYTYVSGPIINGTGNNDPYNSSGGVIPPTYPDTDAWTAAPGGESGYVLAFNAIEQMERTAVSLINGSVYLGFASHGDDGPYYGWVLGYNAATLKLDAAFNTCPTFEPASIVGNSQPFWCLGGIWMSGSNIATDGTNLYVVTGNGAFNGDASNFSANGFPIDHDYGDTVLKLTPDSSSVNNQNGNGWGLKVSDYFTPSNQFELNDLDLDLGSGGVTLLPTNILDSAGHPMLMVGGKESRIYLIDADNMGKFNYNYPTGASSVNPALYDRVVAEYANNGLNTGGAQVYSSASYYDGNIYIGIANHPAVELNLAAMEAGSFVPKFTSLSWGYPGETFEISSNGSSNGIAWAENPGGSDLLAYNASSFTTPIYDSNTNAADALGGSLHFHVPTVASGMVYAGSRGGGLGGYGLDASYLDSVASYFSAASALAATELTTSDMHLTWTSNSSLATEFRIDRSTNGSTWSTLAYVGNTATSYDDTTIAAATIYQYRVVAISGINSTSPSNVVSIGLPVVLTGQDYYLKRDADGTNVDLWADSGATGGVVQSLVLAQLPSIEFAGTGATNSLTIDFSNGDPLPAAGLAFSGSGLSTLAVIGDGGNDSINIGSSTISMSGTFGTATISYTGATSVDFVGGSGSDSLIQSAVPGGGAAVSFNKLNANDTINVSAGSMVIPMPTTGATVPVAQLGTLTVGGGASVSLAAPTGSAGRAMLELGTLLLAGSAGDWLGRFDLAGNDLILHNASLTMLDTQIGQALGSNWAGDGLTSRASANDSTHLTALGAITNNDGTGQTIYGTGDPLGLFDSVSPLVTDILVRQTYFGDANLDGKVDGSDYSRIDSGYYTGTGWYNGDFNYDGLINASDYTLIDNAYNTQGLTGASQLAITTPSPLITAGLTSNNLTIQLRNPLGAVVNAPVGGIAIKLTTTSLGGTFLSNGMMVTSLLIPAGSSSTSFQYVDLNAGTPAITASAVGLAPVSQPVTVDPVSAAAQLAFATAPLNQAVASTSGTMTVELEDASGNLFNAPSGGVTVSLSSSSSGGSFENTSGGAITTITIPAGSSSASFEYTDTQPGVASVSASAAGVGGAVQQETLLGSFTRISFTTPAHTLVLGASPATITIQLDDQAGNPIAAGSGGVTVSLSSTSSGGTFYGSNAAVSFIMIPAGASSATIAYRDTQLGTPSLTASAGRLITGSQQQTVIPLPTGTVAYYAFNTSAGLLADTSGSGNTLQVSGGTVAYTQTNLPIGFTGAASFSNNGYLTTSSGSFPVNVPTGNSSYTISAWIDINNANKNGIVGWGTWGTTDLVNAFRTTQGDAGAGDGTGLDNYWWNNDFIQPTVSLVNNWVYVSVTYNGTVRSMYVNGALVGTFTGNSQDNSVASSFRIGCTNNTEFFGGNMADLLIANTALSTAQIDALYNGT
jgi:hypothetical protein